MGRSLVSRFLTHVVVTSYQGRIKVFWVVSTTVLGVSLRGIITFVIAADPIALIVRRHSWNDKLTHYVGLLNISGVNV